MADDDTIIIAVNGFIRFTCRMIMFVFVSCRWFHGRNFNCADFLIRFSLWSSNKEILEIIR